MSISEFDLIQRFFADQASFPVTRADIKLGIGDDAAIIAPTPGMDLVVTVDTLVAGVHFDPALAADKVARLSLAANLSDLAAMGAQPAWFTLALTLPASDPAWLEAFARGLRDTAQQYQIALIGGDTTKGPLTVTIQAHGYVPADTALRRDGAQVGDTICVSGDLGGPRGGLELWRLRQADADHPLLRSWHNPEPRLALGRRLLGVASAALDISDGLAADLGHILERSGKGALVELASLPLHPALSESFPVARAREYALCGGDDYELCFTVPAGQVAVLDSVAASAGVTITPIGEITTGGGLQVHDEAGALVTFAGAGYQHFSEASTPSRQ